MHSGRVLLPVLPQTLTTPNAIGHDCPPLTTDTYPARGEFLAETVAGIVHRSQPFGTLTCLDCPAQPPSCQRKGHSPFLAAFAELHLYGMDPVSVSVSAQPGYQVSFCEKRIGPQGTRRSSGTEVGNVPSVPRPSGGSVQIQVQMFRWREQR